MTVLPYDYRIDRASAVGTMRHPLLGPRRLWLRA